MAVGATTSIEMQFESVASVWDEAIPLMRANHAEVGGLPERHFNPQRASFEQLESAGFMRVYTMRLIGALIGYAVFVLTPHLNYPSEVVATSHVVYVTPEHRGRRSIKFLLWCRKQLEEAGAHYWGLQCPVSNDWSKTLVRLGLRPMETYYIGELA